MRSMLGPLLGTALAIAACGDDADAADAGAARDGAAGGDRDAAAGAAGAGSDADAGGDAAEGPSADCDAEPIPAFADVEIFAKCLGCHSTEVEGANRMGAPPATNLDDYESAAAMAERAAIYVFHDIMPPPRTGITVTDDEKEQLYLWALCGTPE